MEPPSLRLPPSSTKGSWAKQDDERQTTVRRGGNDGPSDGVMALPCDETDVGVVRPLLRLGDGGVEVLWDAHTNLHISEVVRQA